MNAMAVSRCCVGSARIPPGTTRAPGITASCAGGGLTPDRWRTLSMSIPVGNDDGSVTELAGRACRPASDVPATVVVINHGSPSSRNRPLPPLFPCDGEASSWFLRRRFVVVEALRRGYGVTGG